MNKSPVIEADIGDGENRRLYLGANEIKLFESETGKGWRSFYNSMASGDVLHWQIKRALRLALIGGGEIPEKANSLVEYCANPPMPLKPAYIAVSLCLEAIWSGYPDKKGKSGSGNVNVKDEDKILEIMQANFAKSGYQVELSGLSMAHALELHERIFSDNKPEAPVEIWEMLHGKK